MGTLGGGEQRSSEARHHRGGPYETVACLAATATNYTDTGLVDGTAYYYVVSAAYAGNPNSGGESVSSSG